MRMLLGGYEPDKPGFLSDGLQIASNTYRSAVGYRPVGQFNAVTTALSSRPMGAATFVSPAGLTSIIAGTQTNLYKGNLTGWTSVGSGYTMSATDRWRFAQFGGLAIATNGVDPMQKIDLTSFTTANLGGSPPKAKMLAVVKDFLVGGNIDGVVNKVRWSGINNAEAWTIGLAQSDYQILPTGGEVTGLLGGEFGLILQRGRVSRMTYVGSNLVFQFDEISSNIGCVSPHSVIQAGTLGFWLSDAGFVMWDGASIKAIGQERIDRTFAARYNNADYPSMSAAIDLKNTLVAWAMPDKIWVYNWNLDSWSIIDQIAPIIFSGFTRSWTLEEIGLIYASLEGVPYTLDSPFWEGGNPLFYAFAPDFSLGSFSGVPLAASWQYGDAELVPGRDARIRMARPLTDATTGFTLSVACRARLGDAIAFNTYADIEGSGDMPVRESGRYARIGMDIAAGTPWTFNQGIDLDLARGARR
jgi:hypothetical protein